VHDPLYTDEELARFGWQPFHLGEAADAVIIQADHVEYRELTDDDLPGVQLVVDGRRVVGEGMTRPVALIGASGTVEV
jgi:UDP-N-acetyl-D-mannosaminuronate dehydrogenase